MPLFAVLLLSIGIPVLYVVIGSAVGILATKSRITAYMDDIDRSMVAGLSGVFWPIALIFAGVYVLLNGHTKKGTRLSRAQRKAQRVAKKIAAMERELGIE